MTLVTFGQTITTTVVGMFYFLNSLGVISVHAKSTTIIDTNKIRKLLIKDDNNQFYNYHPMILL